MNLAAFLSGILIGTVVGAWYSWHELQSDREAFNAKLAEAEKVMQKIVDKYEARVGESHEK